MGLERKNCCYVIGHYSLYLACRHRILKLLSQLVFITIMRCTAASEVLLFKGFQAQWKFLDKKVFTTIANHNELCETVKDLDAIAWAEKSLVKNKL